MQIDQIVEDFAIRNRMPEEAIRAATDQADIVVPAFIDYIENCPAHGPFDAGEETPVFLMFHVLGSLRAKAAYRPLARLVNRNDADLDWFIGYDAIFETSHRVIAPLVDGDPKPLYDVIENRDAGEFIRAAMQSAANPCCSQSGTPPQNTTRTGIRAAMTPARAAAARSTRSAAWRRRRRRYLIAKKMPRLMS